MRFCLAVVARILLLSLVAVTVVHAVPVEGAKGPVLAPVVPAPLTAEDLDRLIEAEATRLGHAAPGLCDDPSFLRRVTLDLVGSVPTEAELAAFMADQGPDKRIRMVDSLLARPEFSQHWASVIAGFSVAKAQKEMIAMVTKKRVEAWLAERLAAKDGYDTIVRSMLSAKGTFKDNPATAFVVALDGKAEDLTSHMGKVFLGVQIQCAQCHDHPFEAWTQKDYYGMSAFFARTRSAKLPQPAVALLDKGLTLQEVRFLLRPAMAGLKLKGKKKGKNVGPAGAQGAAGIAAGEVTMAAAGAPKGAASDEMDAESMADGPEATAPGRGATPGLGGKGGRFGGAGGPLGGGGRRARRVQARLAEVGLTPQDVEKVQAELKSAMESGNKLAYRPVPVVADLPRGEAVIPDPTAPAPEKKFQQPKGEQVAPKFLDGKLPDSDEDRRGQLAAWVTAPSNPYFARAAANRFYALLTGRGLVEPVDNIAAPDSKKMAPVLDRLAGAFAQESFDLRAFLKRLTSTRTYQRPPAVGPDPAKQRAARVASTSRHLTPEQLFRSFIQVTGADQISKGLRGASLDRLREVYLRQFVFTFQTDEPDEREVFNETIPQALMMLNSRMFNGPVQAVPGGTLMTVLKETPDPRQRIDRLYRIALGRPARPAELDHLTQYVESRKGASRGVLPEMDDDMPATTQELMGEMPRGKGRGRLLRRMMGNQGGGGRGEGPMRNAMARLGFGTGGGPAARGPAGPAPWSSAGEKEAYEDVFWSLVCSAEFVYNH